MHDVLNKLIAIMSSPSTNTYFPLALGLGADCMLWVVKYSCDVPRLEGSEIYVG